MICPMGGKRIATARWLLVSYDALVSINFSYEETEGNYGECFWYSVSWNSRIVSRLQNELLPILNIFMIFKRSSDQDVLYLTTFTGF